MALYRLEKKRYPKFLKALMGDYEVIAPVKDDVVRFLPIQSPDEIYLEKNAYFPLKEYFFKKHETLFSFDGKKLSYTIPEVPARIFFGIRRCDLNAVHHQDIALEQDPYYQAQRENAIFIGYHCNEAPSKYCFCGTLNLKDWHDLMIFDRGDYYLVEVGSKKGFSLIKAHEKFFKESDEAKPDITIPGADRLEDPDIEARYDNEGWKEGVDKCLSCGACTNLCPTCYCFEIHDEITIAKPQKGERKRTWSSCQLPEFTRVAGDHVFREDREQRFKHRIYHQLDYFKKKHNVPLCTGCGRCIEGCPTRIDFVHILNKMKT